MILVAFAENDFMKYFRLNFDSIIIFWRNFIKPFLGRISILLSFFDEIS
jgi:hypothetical protein